MSLHDGQVTKLLERARAGDDGARDQLLSSIYDELRELARAHFRNERPGHTLEATALVNEICLRLLAGEELPGGNRIQFLSYVAKAMRHVLIDHARRRGRIKRGGRVRKLTLEDSLVVRHEAGLDLLALDESLERLARIDGRKCRVVELRYFGGLTIDEVAEAVGVSPPTVKRDWEVARTWLLADLQKGENRVE